MTSLMGGDGDDIWGPEDSVARLTGFNELLIDPFVGTKGLLCGSNPGAILLNASRLRRSFSSSRERKYASLRAECAAKVVRREDSSVKIWGSRVNG